jgi:hypothetical protein
MSKYEMISVPEMAMIVSTISKESGRKAGNELEAFAHVRGDHETRMVIRETNPLVLSKILGEHDYTIPSISNWLMDADTLTNVIEMQPATWDAEIAHNFSAASAMAFDFFTYVFGLEDDEHKLADIIESMSSSEASRMFLILAFLGWDKDKGIDPEPGNHLFLYNCIASVSPDMAELIDNWDHHRPEEDDIHATREWNRIYQNMLRSVVNNARNKIVGIDDGEMDDMFTSMT